ncbi:L-lactate ferricytochrome c oxidoreductase [Histoplasma capsulatum G186AR]|uniref:L-lactate ferricytochrome c oxidoreductase n=1 Tax=Ajellomyces capsulatus TaxID=5037 RepID=A0A8H7YJQ2_AJECA|nr:L-lactate ferricytochrome c oxidoreductase [Histoplasma capsulatum]QSS75101.1 L-lactate ferricytochrome c oxidoreductase [Histoplasma capsulatum G186AR]
MRRMNSILSTLPAPWRIILNRKHFWAPSIRIRYLRQHPVLNPRARSSGRPISPPPYPRF